MLKVSICILFFLGTMASHYSPPGLSLGHLPRLFNRYSEEKELHSEFLILASNGHTIWEDKSKFWGQGAF